MPWLTTWLLSHLCFCTHVTLPQSHFYSKLPAMSNENQTPFGVKKKLLWVCIATWTGFFSRLTLILLNLYITTLEEKLSDCYLRKVKTKIILNVSIYKEDVHPTWYDCYVIKGTHTDNPLIPAFDLEPLHILLLLYLWARESTRAALMWMTHQFTLASYSLMARMIEGCKIFQVLTYKNTLRK